MVVVGCTGIFTKSQPSPGFTDSLTLFDAVVLEENASMVLSVKGQIRQHCALVLHEIYRSLSLFDTAGQ